MIPGFDAAPMMMGGPSGPALGELFEGGYYVGDITVGGSSYRVLLSPRESAVDSIAWRSLATSVPGASSSTDGLSNTAAIIASSGTTPAASHCVGLSIDGYSDWYLPARDELTLAFSNNAALPSGQNFGVFGHWTSTESNATSAWVRGTGGEASINKTTTSGTTARAVRRSLIS